MKTSEISGKKITPFGFFSFSLLKRKFTSKVSRINFLDKIFTLGISVVEKKESVVDLCIFFFLNTKQTRNLDEEFFQKARQFGAECKILAKIYASERARAGRPRFFGERASASSETLNFWRASELALDIKLAS